MGNGAATTKLGFVISYLIFIGFMLLIIPLFQDDSLFDTGGQSIDTTGAPSSIFDVIGDVFNRFGLLFSLTTSNVLFGVLLTAYTGGFFWVTLEMIRGN